MLSSYSVVRASGAGDKYFQIISPHQDSHIRPHHRTTSCGTIEALQLFSRSRRTRVALLKPQINCPAHPNAPSSAAFPVVSGTFYAIVAWVLISTIWNVSALRRRQRAVRRLLTDTHPLYAAISAEQGCKSVYVILYEACCGRGAWRHAAAGVCLVIHEACCGRGARRHAAAGVCLVIHEAC